MRSRPATTLRPAPAAFQRPVPTAPLTHPIGGGHLHEASSGVHSRSPITPRRPDAAPEPGSALASAGLLLARSPRNGTGSASASTPGFAPRSHPQSTPRRRTGPRALARIARGAARRVARCVPRARLAPAGHATARCAPRTVAIQTTMPHGPVCGPAIGTFDAIRRHARAAGNPVH